MNRHFTKIADNLYYDGCACYGNNGKCICDECFHSFPYVNCSYAGYEDPEGKVFTFTKKGFELKNVSAI